MSKREEVHDKYVKFVREVAYEVDIPDRDYYSLVCSDTKISNQTGREKSIYNDESDEYIGSACCRVSFIDTNNGLKLTITVAEKDENRTEVKEKIVMEDIPPDLALQDYSTYKRAAKKKFKQSIQNVIAREKR